MISNAVYLVQTKFVEQGKFEDKLAAVKMETKL